MSGIVNSTGARSGVIGTTVGTPSGGKVLQVSYVQFTTGGISSSTNTYVDYPQLTLTMTPATTSSKFLINAYPHIYIENNTDDAWRVCNFAIHRSISGGGASGVVWESAGGDNYSYGTYVTDNTDRQMQRNPIMSLHSPNVEDVAVTYKIQFKGRDGYGVSCSAAYGLAEMTLMEVSG